MVPDYQSLMRPLLEVLSDGRQWPTRDAYSAVAEQLGLSENDLSESIASGSSRYVGNVGWAGTYMVQAGLVSRPARSVLQITDRGLSALQSGDPINTAYLRNFEEFQAFMQRTRKRQPSGQLPETAGGMTPDDMMESGWGQLRAELASNLIDRIRAMSPAFFEGLVVELLVAMGYGGSMTDAGMAIGKSGDDGIDGIIKQDRLGLDVVYIQAKRWQGSVGRPDLQAFVGSLSGQGASKGVFITTSSFTKDAIEYSSRNLQNRIVLVDGELLAELMMDYGLGVTERRHYLVQRLDEDYFAEE